MKADLIRGFATRSGAQQIILFLAAGGTATVVQYCLLVTLVELGRINHPGAVALAYLCGAMTSYLLNFRYTFKDSETAFKSGIAKFLAVNGVGLCFNTLIFVAASGLGAGYLLAQASATCLVLTWNYLGARLFVFRR